MEKSIRQIVTMNMVDNTYRFEDIENNSGKGDSGNKNSYIDHEDVQEATSVGRRRRIETRFNTSTSIG